MTPEELVCELCAANIPAYLNEAPNGVGRYAVVSPYAVRSYGGDDTNLLEYDKVQIDIVTQDKTDSIDAAVCEVLSEHLFVWETVTRRDYEREYSRLRTILTVELI